MRLIEDHNQHDDNNFQLKPNQVLGLTNDEFLSMYTTSVKIRHDDETEVDTNLGTSADSTAIKGASSVENQNSAF